MLYYLKGDKMTGRKRIEIDMKRVYKLLEQHKSNREIAKIFTKEGIKVSKETIRKKIKEKPYPIQEKENFKQMMLKGFECFWVSRDGNIFNSKTQFFLKPSLTYDGYYQTSLQNNGIKFKHIMVNQIVYCVWNGIYNLEGKEIHHRDENKTNNNLENLELVCENHGKNYNNTKKVKKNIDKIIEEYKSGLSSTKIAKKWDVSNEFILKILKNNGIKIKKSKKQGIKLPICLVVIWREKGMTHKEISKQLKEKCNIDVGWQTIYNRLKKYYENNN